jgi:hypothetical protein
MVHYLVDRLEYEADPRMRTMLLNLLGAVIRELNEGYKPITPARGQLVLPGFEGIMGFSVVA